VPADFSIANTYRALGVDYTSIDVDGQHGSTFFDLNTFALPPDWMGAFDMANNEGTIEHLINPINGFQVTHELLKPGGVARHSIPLSGHSEHGLLYPTRKFYDLLLRENGYEAIESRTEGDEARPMAAPRLPEGHRRAFQYTSRSFDDGQRLRDTRQTHQ
jgi:SAM-dependent methyltransferase